jgi:hypothetical protein
MTDASADPEPEKLPMPAEGSRLTAAFIATKLRDVGLGCEVVNLEPVETVTQSGHERGRIAAVNPISSVANPCCNPTSKIGLILSPGMGDATALPSSLGQLRNASTVFETLTEGAWPKTPLVAVNSSKPWGPGR